MSSGAGKRAWDPWKMYDVSAEELKAIQERAKTRSAMKAEFQKKFTNPYRGASGQGGHIFDPSIQRFMAMNATGGDHFRATPKTSFQGLLLFVLPVAFFSYLTYKERTEKERKYRNGEVAYKDRVWKFMY